MVRVTVGECTCQSDDMNVQEWLKCPAKIFHLKTTLPCKLDWLEETFVLKHPSDQLWNKKHNALANAHIIQDLKRQTHGVHNRRLCMTDQQALSLSNHQGSLLIHSAEEQVGKVLSCNKKLTVSFSIWESPLIPKTSVKAWWCSSTILQGNSTPDCSH